MGFDPNAKTCSFYLTYRMQTSSASMKVKRQLDAVNAVVLRPFMAPLSDNNVGLFICTGTGGFIKDAVTEARTQEKRRFTLVGLLEILFALWVEYYGKLDEQARRHLPLRSIQFLVLKEQCV
jgi:restriction system protein